MVWTTPIHPDEKEKVAYEWRAATRAGVSHVAEYRIIVEGQVKWIYVQARPEKSDSGEIVNYVGTTTDITKQKSAEEKIRRSEERLRLILDNAADGIITIDSERRIQSFNTAAESVFGYQASEVVGQNVKILMPEPDRSQHDGYVQAYINTGEAKLMGSERHVSGRRKDGTVFPLYLAVSASTVGDSLVFTAVVRDLTKMVMGERRLREARDQAEEATVMIDCHTQDRWLELSVKDTGTGIPAELMKDLFEPFARLEAESGVIEGTGIGLPISKNLVELMGGQIHVESTSGVGSTFTIKLILADENVHTASDEKFIPASAHRQQLIF